MTVASTLSATSGNDDLILKQDPNDALNLILCTRSEPRPIDLIVAPGGPTLISDHPVGEGEDRSRGRRCQVRATSPRPRRRQALPRKPTVR